MLENNAVLVRTVFRAYTPSMSDRAKASELETNNGTKHGKVSVRKQILSEWPALKKRVNIKQNAYQRHIQMTSPWWDDGVRILNSTKIFEYGDVLQKARDELLLNEVEIRDTYGDAVERDKEILQGLAENVKYPTADEIISAFSIDSVFLPVPTSGDFRVEVPANEINKTAEKLRGMEELVRSDITSQIKAAVEHLKDILTRDKTRIHESLVSNLKDLTQRVEYLNVYHDDDVKRANAALRDLVDDIRIDLLRVSPEEKQNVAHSAETFLKDYEGMF